MPKGTFLGSTIRGAIGYLLEKENKYLYDKYYGSGNEYHMYRLDIPKKPKNFDFGLYIFDNDISNIRTIIKVLKILLNSKVLTKNNYTFPDSEIFLNAKKIKFDDKKNPAPFKVTPQRLTSQDSIQGKSISVRLPLPCIIKDKNSKEIYKTYITLEDILVSIYKRKYYYEHGVMLHNSESLDKLQKLPYRLLSLKWKYKIIRREKYKSHFEGMVGQLVVGDLDSTSYTLLRWGEILGVGKSTVFGIGKLKIKVLDENIV